MKRSPDHHLTPSEFRNALYDNNTSNDVGQHLIECKLCAYSLRKEKERNPVYQAYLKAENKTEFWTMMESLIKEILEPNK